MMGLRTELHFHKATLNDMRRIFPRSVIRRRVNRLKVKSSSFRSVVNFVAICISPIITAIRYSEIFADYGCHNGFENRITFSQGRDVFYGRRRFCLSAVSGIINKVNQQ